jgi:hypothetical protein
MTGKAPASKLPVAATEAGRRFDPDLRDRIAPVRRIEPPARRMELLNR